MVAVASMAVVGNVVTSDVEDDIEGDALDGSCDSFDMVANVDTHMGEGDLLSAAYEIASAEEAAEAEFFDAELRDEDEDLYKFDGRGLLNGMNRDLDLATWNTGSADWFTKASDSYVEDMMTGGESADLDGENAFYAMLNEATAHPEGVRLIEDYDEEEDVILYVTEDGTLDGLSVQFVDPNNVNTDVQVLDRGIHVMTVVAAGLNFGLRNIIPLQEEEAA
jgi:hypothetical protein